jgi:hypothetical protein
VSVHDGDYSKVKELLGIPNGEPVFILRAQDRFSVPTIQRYALFAKGVEPTTEVPHPFDPEWLSQVDGVIDMFTVWQQQNPEKVKLPD